MKQRIQIRVRWGDLIRSVVYQTLPYFGVACIWVGAWSKSLESTVRRDLEPHENSEIYPTRIPPYHTHGGQPIADADDN